MLPLGDKKSKLLFCRDMKKCGDRGKDSVDHCLEAEQRQICRSIGNLKKMLKRV